ncbi:MAG: alcohol dehydrogenase catalytic domain-containing protein [Phycisphaerae bacterium]|jgi:L-iditol 2-dehydrogenase|nr:alcohol dehydrogenase catalytic domain-containing protein [Phycisphaerae bacterium]
MKAVRYYGPGDVRVEQIPVPVCGSDEMLVKIEACAVCGSDLKTSKVGNPRMKEGAVMGHEFCAIVQEVGPDAEAGDLKIGDRIVMATSIACGECLYCRRGWRNICQNVKPMGFAYDGGMAEYTIIPPAALRGGHVVKVPEGLTAEHAALAEPISCAVNSLEQCNIEEGDTVLVVGAGPMGLLNVLVARARGAAKIILSEPNAARLAQGEPFCDVAVNPSEQDLAEVVKAETEDGLGVDICIVAAPAAPPQEQAVHLVRKRGTVCLFASLPVGRNMLNIDSRAIHYNEIRVVGTSDSTAAHVSEGIRMLADGRVDGARIATHILTLDDIKQAFELMISGEALRVVLKP